jgi:class 3 adenylate cyclase
MEFTVGDVVNRAARYCAAASAAEILISPEVQERVWKIVETERKTIRYQTRGRFRGLPCELLEAVSRRHGRHSLALQSLTFQAETDCSRRTLGSYSPLLRFDIDKISGTH